MRICSVCAKGKAEGLKIDGVFRCVSCIGEEIVERSVKKSKKPEEKKDA